MSPLRSHSGEFMGGTSGWCGIRSHHPAFKEQCNAPYGNYMGFEMADRLQSALLEKQSSHYRSLAVSLELQ
jgi:hypothetical protein